jgi:dynein light chain Tctex-type 1
MEPKDVEEFSFDDCEVILKSSIGSVLTDSTHWKANKVNDLSNSIISAALKGLQSLNRPYKYVVTVILMQKNGAGLVSAGSTFWDTRKDGLCKVVWENQTTHCIVTVYGMSLNADSDEEKKNGDDMLAQEKEEAVVEEAQLL